MEISGIVRSEKYYKSPHLSDVTLFANDSSIGIPCHKIVLGSGCDYFECLFNGKFNGKFKEQENKETQKITLHDFSYYWLDKFIQFIYCGKMMLKYEEFIEAVNYSKYLQIPEFWKLCNIEKHISELFAYYTHNELYELVTVYKLESCKRTLITNILTNFTRDMLQTLNEHLVKEIRPLIPIFIYNREIRKKYTSQEVDDLVENIPFIYEISLERRGYAMSLYKLDNVNATLILHADCMIISTIIRNNITTVVINGSKRDSLLRKAMNHVISKGWHNTSVRIISPNENTCIIVQREHFCEIIIEMIIYNGTTFEEISVFTGLLRYYNGQRMTFSQYNMYIAKLECRYTLMELSYCIVDIMDHSNKRMIVIPLSYDNGNGQDEYIPYSIYDMCYGNNFLYVLIKKESSPKRDEFILVVNTETNQLMYKISSSYNECTNLISFGNIVYYIVFKAFEVCNCNNLSQPENGILELNEIRDRQIVPLNKSFNITSTPYKFVITGSYQSDALTPLIS